MDLTPNYKLKKPSYEDGADIASINSNMDSVDTELKQGEDHRADTANPHQVTASQVGASPLNHNHDGVYSPANHNHDGRYATAAQGTNADNALWIANAALPKSGGTMTGQLTAQANANYGTRQVRNVIISSSTPSGGANGDVWLQYK